MSCSSKLKLIVGLGNPGKEYENTRHNIGFEVIDRLSTMLDSPVNKSKFSGLYTKTRYKSQTIYLLKPLSYMNRSGGPTRNLADYFDIPAEDIIVIYDDMDIEFGQIKIRKKGSAGGHNGMKSIINHLQSQDFPRIRIGIGRRDLKEELTNFVLSRFSKDDQKQMDIAVENAANAALAIVDEGLDNAMNKYN